MGRVGERGSGRFFLPFVIRANAILLWIALRIFLVIRPQEWPAVIVVLLQQVQLFGWNVIAHPVKAMIHAPHLLRHWMPGETDRVAQSRGEDVASGTIRWRDEDRRVLFVHLPRSIRGAADGDIELPVG